MSKKKVEKVLLTHQDCVADFNKVINENARLVNSIVMRYLGMGVGYIELMTVANEGLYMAYLRYDSNRGSKFSSFAYNYVKNEILETISLRNSNGVMSNADVADVRKIRRITNQYIQDHDENPTAEQISKISGGEFTPQRIKKLMSSSKMTSLDANIGEDLTLGDVIASEEEEHYDDTLSRKIEEMLSKLNQEEREVVTHYYFNEITNMAEIARLMKSNANHINTVFRNAIKRIKSSGILSIKEERSILEEKLKKLN